MTPAPESGPQAIVFLGGPGAGKGTQASRLAPILGVPHVSSGELIRHLATRGDPRMKQGELLPDDVATEIVLNRLEQPDAKRGAILDGFPRTLRQAEALDAWLARRGGAIRAVIYLDVPRPTMVERVVDRGVASKREDDRADIADRRADIFAAELQPLLEYYSPRGVVHQVDGTRSISEVQRDILEALTQRR